MADRFKALSAEALNLQQLRADRTAERTMTDTQRLLTPVSEALDKLEHRLADVERQRATMTASLGKQVELVNAAGEGLRRETASLVTALRAPQVRGAWGEMQLRRVVELAGLVEHCDFEVQSTTVASGQPLRPDMTIRMAGGRCVHVDAKTPLSAFLDAAGTDEPDRAGRLIWPISPATCAATSTISPRRPTGAPSSTPPSS
jgi:DNA recombination protein RmuC